MNLGRSGEVVDPKTGSDLAFNLEHTFYNEQHATMSGMRSSYFGDNKIRLSVDKTFAEIPKPGTTDRYISGEGSSFVTVNVNEQTASGTISKPGSPLSVDVPPAPAPTTNFDRYMQHTLIGKGVIGFAETMTGQKEATTMVQEIKACVADPNMRSRVSKPTF